MTDEELSAIEERAKAATAGPWRVEEHALDLTDAGTDHGMPPMFNREVRTSWVHGQAKDTFPITPVWVSPFYSPNAHVRMSAHDATFIAAARTDVPALVEEVRRLRAEVAQVNRVLTGERDAADALLDQRDEALAEVRRLRAEVERLQGEVVEARERLREERATTDAQTDQRDELLRALVACRAEVERLRP